MGQVLGIVYRTVATHLTKKTGYTKTTAHTGAGTLIQPVHGELQITPRWVVRRVHGNSVASQNDRPRHHVWQSPRVVDRRVTYERAGDCTTRQFNAHNTETRTVCYPWHPWYGHTVTVRASVVRRDRAIYRCQLEPDAFVKSLEIPQWMFDPVLCAAMCQQEMPVVNGEALLHLKVLLAQAAVSVGSAVVQHQSHCTSTRGETDATQPRSTSDRSIRPISSAPNSARLAHVAGPGKAASCKTSGANVSRTSTAALSCRRTGPGGGR